MRRFVAVAVVNFLVTRRVSEEKLRSSIGQQVFEIPARRASE